MQIYIVKNYYGYGGSKTKYWQNRNALQKAWPKLQKEYQKRLQIWKHLPHHIKAPEVYWTSDIQPIIKIVFP